MNLLNTENNAEKLFRLNTMELVKYLRKIAIDTVVTKSSPKNLARIKHMNEQSIYHRYNKNELVEMILDFDSQEIFIETIEAASLKDNCIKKVAVSPSTDISKNTSEVCTGKDLIVQTLGATSTKGLLNKTSEVVKADGFTNEICIICDERKQQREFDANMDICKYCLQFMSKKQAVIYLFRLLNDSDKSSLSKLFINLKSESQNKVLSDFTKLELKDMILELTSADGLEATSTNDLLNKALEVDFVDDPANETCIVCNTGKNQKEFEHNIEICKKCFTSMNKMQNVDYLLQILNRKENSSLSNFFKTLKLENKEYIYSDFTKLELKDMIMELASATESTEDEEWTIDVHSILEEYSEAKIGDYSSRRKEKIEHIDDVWRQHVSLYLKRKFPGWETASIETVYSETNQIIAEYGKMARKELMGFSVDLSQTIFESNRDTEDVYKEISDLSEEVELYITYMVEMIILPHLEVLDRIREAQGNILFVDINKQHFSEGLKRETKDRDGWKCVICKSDIDLHVHHRIPRQYGGVNHLDNLVTLCSSCCLGDCHFSILLYEKGVFNIWR